MNRVLKFTGGVFAAAFLCVALTGCGDSKKEPVEPEPQQPKVTIKVEPQPADSPEMTRIHKFDEFDRRFETEIAYRDKSKGLQTYNPASGDIVEFKRWYPSTSTLQQHQKFTHGQLMWEETYHNTGKVQQRRMWHKNGDRELLQFTTDGVSEVGKVLIRKDGSGEWIQRIQDWQTGKVKGIRQLYTWKPNGDLVREEYDYQNGTTLLTRAETNGENLVLDIYQSGKVIYRQYHKLNPPTKVPGTNPGEMRMIRPFGSPWILQKTEVMGADGKTVERTFIFNGTASWPGQPVAVHFPQPGGGKMVVETGTDNQGGVTVKGEKVYDKDGKLVSEQQGKTSAKTEDLKADYRAMQQAYNVQANLKAQMEAYFRR